MPWLSCSQRREKAPKYCHRLAGYSVIRKALSHNHGLAAYSVVYHCHGLAAYSVVGQKVSDYCHGLAHE